MLQISHHKAFSQYNYGKCKQLLYLVDLHTNYIKHILLSHSKLMRKIEIIYAKRTLALLNFCLFTLGVST